MKKRWLSYVAGMMVISSVVAGCATKDNAVGTNTETSVVETTADTTAETTEVSTEVNTQGSNQAVLEDGVYLADFTTDSSMFHVNEAKEGKGELTVKDGVMIIHVSLTSKNILNLYAGLAEDASKEGAAILVPTTDVVTYSDGLSDEVYGFDIPVPYLDDTFDVALVGKKGTWYDHKVSVSNVSVAEAESVANLNDGEYSIEVTLEGGSGKAKITTPTTLVVKNGEMSAVIAWSSSNYDYMRIGETKYDVQMNAEGQSSFVIPVSVLDAPMTVIADTTAMSTPHEIEYQLIFDSKSIVTK